MTVHSTQTKSVGYQRTEVGTIPSDWQVKSLCDLFTFSGGYTASREQLSNDGICYLHYGDIHKSNKTYIDVQKEFSDIPKLNIRINLIPKKSLLNDGDVVFVDASEDDEGASKHIVVRNSKGLPYISGLHTIVSKSKGDSLENLYKQYCFQTHDVKRQFKFYAVGTKVSGISKTNIARIFLPNPSKSEQIVIASVLSDVDSLIASLEKLIAKKYAIKQGTMQELLTGKRRLPGFTGEWKVTKLGECLIGHPEYGINAPAVTYSDDLPAYLRITDISEDGKFMKSSLTSVNHLASQLYYLENGDLVFARTGASVGKTYLYNSRDGKLVFAGFLIKVKPNPDKLNPLYLKYFTQTQSYWDWVKIMSMRSGQPGINGNEYKELPITMPSTALEQTAIVKVLNGMNVGIELLEKKLTKYKMLRQGMMQILLTGKVRIA